MSRLRCSDRYVYLDDGRRVKLSDIEEVRVDGTPHRLDRAETRRLLEGAGLSEGPGLGEGAGPEGRPVAVTVLLGDGTEHPVLPGQTRRRDAAARWADLDFDVAAPEVLYQVTQSRRVDPDRRAAALETLERHAPGIGALPRLDPPTAEVLTTLLAAGHGAGAVDLVSASLSRPSTSAEDRELSERPWASPAGPRGLEGAGELCRRLGGTVVTVTPHKGGGSKVVVKTPGRRLQNKIGDPPEPDFEIADNDPEKRRHNSELARQFGATYAEFRVGTTAMGGEKTSVVAFYAESPEEVETAIYGTFSNIVENGGGYERVWTLRHEPEDIVMQTDTIGGVTDLTEEEAKRLVSRLVKSSGRFGALAQAQRALPDGLPLRDGQLFGRREEACVSAVLATHEATHGDTPLSRTGLLETIAALPAGALWFVEPPDKHKSGATSRQTSTAPSSLESRQSYTERHGVRTTARPAQDRYPGDIVVDHRGRTAPLPENPHRRRGVLPPGSIDVCERDVVFHREPVSAAYAYLPTTVDAEPEEVARMGHGHIRGLVDGTGLPEVRGMVRFVASEAIAERAAEVADAVVHRAGVGLMPPADRRAVTEFVADTFEVTGSREPVSFKDLVEGVTVSAAGVERVLDGPPSREYRWADHDIDVYEIIDVPGGELVVGRIQDEVATGVTFITGDEAAVVFLADHPVYFPEDR